MGKRGAEKELTQNNWQENEDESNSEGGSGEFKKASTAQIGERKIRGMPKRKGAAAPQPAAPSAFGGTFGAAPNPFAALASPAATPAPAANGTAPSPFTFGATASTPTFGSSSSTASLPAAATSSPFSFGASTTTTFTPATVAPTASAKPASTDSDADYKYYTSLRGLNVSLIDSLSKSIEQDPFVDLGSVLANLKTKYEQHRVKVQKEYDGKAGAKNEVKDMQVDADKPTPPTIPAIFTTPPSSVPSAPMKEKKQEEKEEGKKSAMPAPPTAPAAFSFAGSTFKPSTDATPTSSSSTPAVGGFVFKSDAPADPYAEKSSFKFPVTTPAAAPATTPSAPVSAPAAKKTSPITAPPAPKLAPAKLTNPPTKPSPLRFGQSVSPPSSPATKSEPSEKKEDSKPKSGFSFGATFGSIAKGDDDKKVEDKKETTPAVGGFSAPVTGAFTFGSASTSSTSAPAPTSTPAKTPFTFGGTTPFSTPASSAISIPKAAPSPPIATSFGSSSPPQFSFGAALQPKDKDNKSLFGAAKATGFGFGSSIGGTSSTTTAGSSGFSFGQPSTPTTTTTSDSEPATTGFSFGSSTTNTAPATTTSGFSFGSTSTTAPSTTSPFSFSSKPTEPTASSSSSQSPVPDAAAATEPEASTSQDAAAASGSESTNNNQTPGGNPFAAPGAGEEGETVFHQVRGKVYRLKDGSQDLGIAKISIKEREQDGKKKFRLLARNETNGAVLINFALYADFNPKVEKAFITFLGFDEEGKPVQYRLRVKTKEMVDELDTKLKEAVQLL
ncbi:uncharacterized protein JCM15063_004596 [Sporobolomyces koalae]|uniref:uncharacterized protein n=1 Tax=Sporobolomyces koalae TaxID=500713 RepID=UPI00316DB1B0